MKNNIDYLPVHMIYEGYDIKFDKKRNFDLIIINNNLLKIKNKENVIEIKYEQIKKVAISLCSIMDYYTLTQVWFNFHVFVTIYADYNTYYLECENDDVLIPFLKILHKKNILVEDLLNIEKIYLDYPEKIIRNKYLEKNMKKISKQFNIKYPTRVFMGKLNNK